MQDKSKVLVPIRVLEGESIPDGIPRLLAGAHVILLGYYEVPDQTAPGQARVQFEDRALERLEQLEDLFESAGSEVDHRLVFTHNVQKTIDRFIKEEGCHAVLVPSAVSDPNKILVAVRGTVGSERIATVVAGVFGPLDVEITLFHVVQPGESVDDAEILLAGILDRIVESGIDPDTIDFEIESADDPTDTISDRSADFDVVVMGESDPSLSTFVFGMSAEKVADAFLGPVLIVQREPDEAS